MDERLTLENRILGELSSYDGTMGIYINDFKGNCLKINETMRFESASTIKIFILASLYAEVESGNKRLEDLLTYKKHHYINGSGILKDLDAGIVLTVKNAATLMIIVSDNIATNMVIDYLGLDTINKSIREFGCKDTVLHNSIDYEHYERLGTTTPKDYGSMFERMAAGELVSESASKQMLEILKKQHYNNMLLKNLPAYCFAGDDGGRDDFITVASKSGSMNACRNDGGIVSTPYGSYVIVLMNKEFHDPLFYGEHSATVFGSRVSRVVFDQYLALEGRLVL